MQRLRGSDAQTIYHESYASPFVTLKAVIYEQVDPAAPFDPLELKSSIINAFQVAGSHGMGMRVLRVPLDIHHPVWVQDPDFSIDDHIYHVSLPAPGNKAQLCDFISRLMGIPLDPNRPLWDAWIVEGLEGGRVALVSRVHHVLADGLTSVKEIIHVHQEIGSPPAEATATTPPVDPIPGDFKLAMFSLVELFRDYVVDFPRFYRRIKKVRAAARDLKDSDTPAAKPFTAPFTFLNKPGGPYREYRYETFTLSALKHIARHFDCTLNTLVLGICAEALRRYFLLYDKLPSAPLVVSMPMGVGAENDELKLFGSNILNNNLALALVRLDLGIADFELRLADIGESARAAVAHTKKTEGRRFDNYFDFVPGTFVRLLNRFMENRQARQESLYSNTVISNVPGPRDYLYTCGEKLRASEILSCGNLGDPTGLNITVWSYVDKLTFSFFYRKGIFPQPDKLNGLVTDVVEELCAKYPLEPPAGEPL